MTQDLATTIAGARGDDKPKTAHDLVESMRGEFVKALPEHVSVDNFMRLALTELRGNPRLAACSGPSLLGALMVGARTGLEVGGPLGELYLTPRAVSVPGPDGKKSREWQVVPVIGYRGLIKLARNTGKVGAIDAELIREGDHFVMGFDTRKGGKFVEWSPLDYEDTRPVIGVLAHAELIGAGMTYRYMPMSKVLERKGRGSAGDKGPWATDFEAMVRKTGLRALAPVLPQSSALALAVKADEETAHYSASTMIEAEPIE